MRYMSTGALLASALGGAGFNVLSLAIFDAFTTPPTAERKVIIDTAVLALVAGGVWDELDALYMLAAADSQAALVNWKNPGTFDAVASGGPTFTADRGFTGDATDAQLDAGFNPTTAASPHFTQNSASMAAWALTDAADNKPIIGNATDQTGTNIYPNFAGDAFLRLNDATEAEGFAVAGGTGFFLANRSTSTGRQGYRNGASLGAYASNTSKAVLNEDMKILRQGTKFSGAQVAAASFGGSLDATQQLAFYNAMLAYMQAVGAV